MESNITVEKLDADMFFVSEDGDIYIDKAGDSLTLISDSQDIDLNKEYKIEGLTVLQDEAIITLENEDQLKYMKQLIAENIGNTDSK